MRVTIIHTDTIKINVPESLDRSLSYDMTHFEVFKKDGERLNFNSFMSSLIAGYYDQYRERKSGQAKRTRELLARYITDPRQLARAASEIMNDETVPTGFQEKAANSIALKFRPTRETDGIILEIEKQRQSENESISGFFRQMLYSYLQNPVYEREKIIYYRNTAVIEEACRRGKEIAFTTRDNPAFLHTVIPYGLRHSPDELFNYLLCQESNQSNGKKRAMSYRLCRIVNPRIIASDGQVDHKIRLFLEKMEKYGPQYPINKETAACIRLTPAGRVSFQKLYQGRPVADRRDTPDPDGSTRYYFSCAQEQIYLYFRRFNPGEATVLYPEELKRRLIEFHRKHLECLQT